MAEEEDNYAAAEISGKRDKPKLMPLMSSEFVPTTPVASKVNHHSILLTWREDAKESSEESIDFNPEAILEIEEVNYDYEHINLDEVDINESTEPAVAIPEPSAGSDISLSQRPLFLLQWEKKPDNWINLYSGYARSYLIENLEPEKEYKYRLRVKDVEKGDSIWSSPIVVTTSREKIYSDRLHKCIARNDLDNVAKILDSGEVKLDALNEHGLTPLMHAAQRGNRRLVRMLLLKGCNVNLQNEIGRSCLMQAAFAGHLDCVRLLVDKGANWNQQDKTGQTALHLAVDNGHVDVVEFATRTGANVNLALFHSGWTPLFRIAAVSGVHEMVELLVRAGADVNLRDTDGKTALMTAVINNHINVVKELVQHGSDLSLKNNFGRTAYQMAIAMDRKDIIKYMEKQITGSKIYVAL